MKHKEIMLSTCLSYDDLEELDIEIDNFEFEDDYIPSIEELEKNLIPYLDMAIKIEEEYLEKSKKDYQKKLKKESLETPIFYIKYLMWLQKQIAKKEDSSTYKDVKTFIQKLLYKYIIIEEDD